MTSPEFTGEGKLALPGHDQGLDAQQFAADLGPGQSGHHAYLVRFLYLGLLEARRPEVFGNRPGRYFENLFLFVFNQLPGDLPTHRGNLALQVADTGFSGYSAG